MISAHPCVPSSPSLTRRLQVDVTADREINRRERVRVQQADQNDDQEFCVRESFGHTNSSSAPVVTPEHARPTVSYRCHNFRDEA